MSVPIPVPMRALRSGGQTRGPAGRSSLLSPGAGRSELRAPSPGPQPASSGAARVCCAGVTDHSNSVAAEVLVRGATADGARGTLTFRNRTRWHVVAMFGSWALVILAPMLILAMEEGATARELMAALLLGAVGLTLGYVAARELVNGAQLAVDGRLLRFRRGPLWPFGARSWPLDTIVGTRIELHPDSFRYPARVRGFEAARPYLVHLLHGDEKRSTLPLALGRDDAHEVAAWVMRHAR